MAQDVPFSSLLLELRQELLASRDRLVSVYLKADTALTRYVKGFRSSDLAAAAEVLCGGLKELGVSKHPLWRAMAGNPSILDVPSEELNQVLQSLDNFMTAESAILRAAGMDEKAADKLAQAAVDALGLLKKTGAGEGLDPKARVAELITVANSLRKEVCDAETKLKKGGWTPKTRKKGLLGLFDKISRSKWFVGGATTAATDATTFAVPVFGWFGAALTSPLAAVVYMLEVRRG